MLLIKLVHGRVAMRMASALMSALLAMLVLGLTPVSAQAQTINWTQWTAVTRYPLRGGGVSYTNRADGTLTLPDGRVVAVVLTGEVHSNSCFQTLAVDCTTSTWWRSRGWGSYPAGTFTSADAPTLPDTDNMIAMTGFPPGMVRHTLTFSQPVTNIVMPIFSLGTWRNSRPSEYQFDQDFTLLSQNPTCAGAITDPVPLDHCLVVQGRTLAGREGSGTIQFTGTVTSISWDVTTPENYSGFNIGVTSAFVGRGPSPSPVPALATWVQAALALLLSSFAAWQLRRR